MQNTVLLLVAVLEVLGVPGQIGGWTVEAPPYKMAALDGPLGAQCSKLTSSFQTRSLQLRRSSKEGGTAVSYVSQCGGTC